MDNSIHSQRLRILERLKKGSLTTIESRRDWSILHPAGRVQELRDRGYAITTLREIDYTEQGEPRRVARYVLLSEKGGQS